MAPYLTTARLPQTHGLFAPAILGLVLALTSLVVACGDGPSSPSDAPNLTILLTDDLTDEVEAVNVFFTSVTAKPAGGPVVSLDLVIAPNPIDLLTLDDEVVALASAVLDPGAYTFLQINIAENLSSIVESGVTKPLRIPSQEVKILGGFEIVEDQDTTLTLDFDADDSLVQLGHGGWLMRPVIVMTGRNTSPRS